MIVVVLTGVILVLFWRPTTVRRWALAVNLRALVLIHTTRGIGAYFLFLYRRGELPYGFAVPGGWGDIIVGVSALAICLVGADKNRAVVVAWNPFGLLDILLVVATAASSGWPIPIRCARCSVRP